MNLQNFLVIAFSGCMWALFDLSRKKLADQLNPVFIVILLMALQTPIFLTMSFWDQWSHPTLEYFAFAFVGILLNCFANVMFLASVRLAPLSLAIPVLSLTPVFSAMGAYLFLREPLSLQQIFGIAMVVSAMMYLGKIAFESDGEAGPIQVHLKSDVGRGLMMMLGVSLIWAITPVLDKICLMSAPASQHAFVQCAGIAFFLIFYQIKFLSFSDFLLKARARGWLVASVAVASLALVSQFWVMRLVSIGIFESLKRSIGLLASLSFGYLFFSEPLNLKKVSVAFILGTGIAVLLL